MIGRNKVNSGGRMTCNALFAIMRQMRMAPMPETSLTKAQNAQVASKDKSFLSRLRVPVVATVTWLMLTLYHRPTAMPAATATKAIASSKHGQSSTGSGCMKTRPKVRGTINVGTIVPLCWRKNSYAGVTSMFPYQMPMPRSVPAAQSETVGQSLWK